jgi:phosphotransferase system  glucose/maltose/N-acetylglucosamine-specific IIC component
VNERPAQPDARARAALVPLDEHERPRPLLVAVAVAIILAVGIVVSLATTQDPSHEGGATWLIGGVFLACVLGALAWGMYRRRYWAVLGFEALLAFQVVVTSLALVVVSSWLAASWCTVAIALSGWLFWKLVRVMGRIQATDHLR